MTTVDLSMLVLLAAALLFAGVRRLIEAGPEPITPDPVPVYEAPFGQPGTPLPKRPEGMASLKAEIALTPPGYVPAPPVDLRTRKAHADWPWDTAEIEMRWDAHFADQPDDQAVQREWIGAGR